MLVLIVNRPLVTTGEGAAAPTGEAEAIGGFAPILRTPESKDVLGRKSEFANKKQLLALLL